MTEEEMRNKDIERILVIRPYHPASLSHRGKVRETFGISDDQLDNLIDTGNGMEDENGKTACFDYPIPEAYIG